MEESEDYQFLKRAFKTYLDSIRSLGQPFEDTCLGAIVAFIALRESGQRLPQDRVANVSDWLKVVVKEFEYKHSHIFAATEGAYVVMFGHEALHRFLYETAYLSVDLDVELIDLLEELGAMRSGGISRESTPKGVAELMTRALTVKPLDHVFDPAMGTGMFLSVVARHVHGEFLFSGFEAQKSRRLITSLKAHLMGHENFFSLTGDVFERSKIFSEYDVILSNPPIGRIGRSYSVSRHDEREIISADLSLNYIELSLQHLKIDGKAAFLVPVGSLFSAGKAELVRRRWVEQKMIQAVITLPAGALLGTRVKCAILLFWRGSAELDYAVSMISAEDCTSSVQNHISKIGNEEIEEILSRLNNCSSNALCRRANAKEIDRQEHCLLPALYLDKKHGRNRFLADNWKKLGELADVMQGSPLSKAPAGREPIIQGRDLRVDKIDRENLAKKDLSHERKTVHRCRSGDILLQRIGNNPAAYMVTDSEDGMAVADTVFILRFNSMRYDVINFITQYINSGEISSRVGNARNYAAIPTQTKSSILSLEVPIPDDKIVSLVRDMNELESSLKVEYEKAIDYKRALFSGYDASDIASDLENSRFTLRALDSALTKKDDVRYRVRTQYPFPLAYAYRNIYLEREYAGLYEKQMKYGEQFLSFFAAVGLCLVARYGRRIPGFQSTELIEIFRDSVRRGISPGDLQRVLQECCKILSRVEGVRIANEFSQVWFKAAGRRESEFAKATRDDLVVRLNDYKHHRGPANSYERRKCSEKQAEALERMLAAVEFCSEWRLVLIEDIDKGWRDNRLEYSASLLRGDHPAFERIVISTDANLSKDKLYIQFDDEFVCLYPLMSLVYNENTKREEIFSIDKYDDKFLNLRSFDSGTSIRSTPIKDDFEYWLDTHVRPM